MPRHGKPSVVRNRPSKVLPDLVLYDAAVDVHRNDKLGLLDMTSDAYERDKLVLSYFKKRHIPIVTTIGGGSWENREEVAQRHSIVFSAVKSVFGSGENFTRQQKTKLVQFQCAPQVESRVGL